MGKLLENTGNSWDAKFLGYFWNTQPIIYQYFFNLHDGTFKHLSHALKDILLRSEKKPID